MNKTLREIVLRRHLSAQTRLDEMRQQLLSETFDRPVPQRPRQFVGADIIGTAMISLWRELFWRARHAWAGLALVWLALLAVNLVICDTRPDDATRADSGQGAIQALLRDEQQLRTELAEIAPAEPLAAPPTPPRPRSERRVATTNSCA